MKIRFMPDRLMSALGIGHQLPTVAVRAAVKGHRRFGHVPAFQHYPCANHTHVPLRQCMRHAYVHVGAQRPPRGVGKPRAFNSAAMAAPGCRAHGLNVDNDRRQVGRALVSLRGPLAGVARLIGASASRSAQVTDGHPVLSALLHHPDH